MTARLRLAVLNPEEAARLLAVARAAPASASDVSGLTPGRAVLPHVRRSSRIVLPAADEALVRERLEAIRPVLAAHFDRPLGLLEPVQVLRYGPGDFFVAHQDGNTPLIHDDTRHRRVSLSLLLSGPEDYDGADLVFHDGASRSVEPVSAGEALAFPAEATHEVTPLVAGERISIAGWFRAAGVD